MQVIKSIVGLSLVVGLVSACRAPVVEGSLLEEVISAMNSKDQATIEKFLQSKADSSVPLADRVKGMMMIAERGAPFTLKRMVSEAGGQLKALVSDARGLEHGFVLTLSPGPVPKMVRLNVGPPDILEAKPAKTYDGWNTLAELCEMVRADAKAPAMAVATSRDGKIDVAVSGTRSLENPANVGPDEPWSIGSIGKSLCTTVIGKLIESGKLKWETKLGEVLPDVPMQPAYREVTVEQLMQNRSGVPSDLRFDRETVERMIGGETEPTKVRLLYAKDLLNRQPTSAPGTTFEYSNGGFAILGVIAEKVTGVAYEKLVKTHVFDAIGLKSSFTNADILPKNRPSGHMMTPNGLEEANFFGVLDVMTASAGGGMFMSVGDLARYGQAHLNGLKGKGTLLKPETIKRLHKGLPDGSGRSYGCGWGIETVPGIGLMQGHNGSNGTMEAQLSLFPEKGMVVASVMNVGSPIRPAPPLSAVLAVAAKN